MNTFKRKGPKVTRVTPLQKYREQEQEIRLARYDSWKHAIWMLSDMFFSGISSEESINQYAEREHYSPEQKEIITRVLNKILAIEEIAETMNNPYVWWED